MTEQLQETVSALMDGEADELELRRLLKQQGDEQLDGRWCRYHLARTAMHSDEPILNMDISRRVSAAIDQEQRFTEQPETATKASKLAWLRPLSGFAVAASVAVAVVVGVRSLDVQSPAGLPQDFSSVQQVASSSRVFPAQGGPDYRSGPVTASSQLASTAAVPAAERELLRKQAEQRMDQYLLRHNQQLSAKGQGMISFARVASFEAE